MNLKSLSKAFVSIYGSAHEHGYFCPGRVNLIGEHIDYNGGMVMPCAIRQGTYLLVSRNDDRVFRFHSANFNEYAEIPIGSDLKKGGEAWFNYPIGIIKGFADKNADLTGLNFFFGGDIPVAAGLSSSASVGIVTAFVLNNLFNGQKSKLELVRLAKSAENDFIGVNCGIMDQYAVTFGEQNGVLLIDCSVPRHDTVNCDFGGYILVIINTNKKRALAESKYNERVRECELALSALRQRLAIADLCTINAEQFVLYQHLINDETVLKRAKHVVLENQRVQMAADALAAGDLPKFGRLLYQSHDSLKNLYEVSGPELDAVVEYCKIDPNVLGARMTGAGFGGCAIALVKKSGLESFTSCLIKYYQDKVGYAPSIYLSEIADGVHELKSDHSYA